MKMEEAHMPKLPPIPGFAEAYIHLAGTRTIFLSEDVTKESASQLTALLIYFDQISDDEICIYIHSNGGDLSGLIQIYDVMKMIKSPVRTICLGKAYSAGAILLAAGSKGLRGAFKHSNIMIHGIQCVFPIPGHDQINSKNYFQLLKGSNDTIMKILSDHTGHDLEKIKSDCQRDLYLDAKEALEYGIIDYIL